MTKDWNASYKVQKKKRSHSFRIFSQKPTGGARKTVGETQRNSLRPALHKRIQRHSLALLCLSFGFFLTSGKTRRLASKNRYQNNSHVLPPRNKPLDHLTLKHFQQGFAFWGKGEEMKHNRLFWREEWREVGGTATEITAMINEAWPYMCAPASGAWNDLSHTG